MSIDKIFQFIAILDIEYYQIFLAYSNYFKKHNVIYLIISLKILTTITTNIYL